MCWDLLTYALMGTFLIIVIGVIPDHTLQMPAMKNTSIPRARHEKETVTAGQLGAFHLSMENNQLLSQQGIF
jgi:hypothetical protein